MRMRRDQIIGAALLFTVLAVTGCKPSSNPETKPGGPPLTGAEENVLGETLTDARGGFSYRMPAKWSAVDSPDGRYLMAQEPVFPGYRSNITLSRETAPLRFESYVEESRKGLLKLVENARLLEDSEFVTSAGLKGHRWVASSTAGNVQLWQVFYLFPGNGDDKLMLTASATRDQGQRLAFVFDAAVKTFKVK
jgi:hypothetical protein